jgi:hypothetical protein
VELYPRPTPLDRLFTYVNYDTQTKPLHTLSLVYVRRSSALAAVDSPSLGYGVRYVTTQPRASVRVSVHACMWNVRVYVWRSSFKVCREELAHALFKVCLCNGCCIRLLSRHAFAYIQTCRQTSRHMMT